ncbi:MULTISPECIES: hypothetical protein [Haloferax]|uniref:Uncharacterized protein n=1 Tax=Haloferax marinum TaxID=2666143 RepID=A0A6A8G9T8_9EURY|nr:MULTISPECIES: hypothetical protein [Haloferax]MRW97475.1 hypothetical protein [Haloferax marinum]
MTRYVYDETRTHEEWQAEGESWRESAVSERRSSEAGEGRCVRLVRVGV